MRITFAFLGALALVLAVLFFLTAKSAVHEILAAIMLLIFTVCAATTALLSALEKLHRPALTIAAAPLAPTTADTEKPASIFPAPAPKPGGGRWVKSG